jgi:hypothetical protein
MKKPQLIALGVIVSGLFFFGIGIFLLAKETFNPVANVNNSVASKATPTATTLLVSNSTKPRPSPTPVQTPVETPEPRIPSSVQWIGKDSLNGSSIWKVVLTSNKWFDTGIPYITNDTVNINQYDSENTDPNTLIKLNGKIFANRDGRQISYFDRDGFSPKIRDTVKLKLDGGGVGRAELKIALVHVNAMCPDYANHKEIHEASIAWSDNMVNRTKK